MVGRRDFGSYCRADANGDSRDARAQYHGAHCSMNAISVLARLPNSGVLRLPPRFRWPCSPTARSTAITCCFINIAATARTDARAGLCGVHGDLGRDRGVFVRRDSGVLGAAEAPRTLSASLTPLPEGSCRRRRLRGGRHGKQQKPRSRPKPQTPLTKQACTSSP